MADNVSNASVNDDVIAADDINGIKYQRVKLAIGKDGEYSGDVSKDIPLPSISSNVPYTVLTASSVAANTSIMGILDASVGGSFKLNLLGDVVGTGVLNVIIEISDNNSIWEIYYQNKYGITAPNFRISLPALPITSKYVRCIVAPNLDIVTEVSCVNFTNTAKAYRQRIFSDIAFKTVNDVTPSLKIDGLQMLNAVISEVPTGEISYKWEISINDLEWLSASAITTTSTTGVTCSIATNYGYSYARLRVVQSTATVNPATIVLQGLA